MAGNRLKFLHHLDDDYCPNLVRLSCCSNRLRTTLAQWACSLKYVFLNHCKIRKIEGMENLVNMTCLNLRGNRLKKLHGFTWHMQSLRYLNLRDNKISNIRQFKRLRPLPRLRVLIATGNPFIGDKTGEKVRWGLLYAYKKLVRINKKMVEPIELANRDLGKDDIDNDEESSDDAIAEDSEEEEEGPPIEWDDDDDPESANFDPKRTHHQVLKNKRLAERIRHNPILADMYGDVYKAFETRAKDEEEVVMKAKSAGQGEGEGSEEEGASSEGGTTEEEG